MVPTISYDQSALTPEVKRVQFELTESKVSVKFLQDFSGFTFEGITIPAVSIGSRIEVPFFIAENLLEKELIEDFMIDFPDSLQALTAAVRAEVRSGRLQSLHPYFNVLIKELMQVEAAEESRYNDLELKRKRDKLNQLIHERVAKIVTMAKSGETLPRRTNLTASEKILYNKMIELIKQWKEEFTQY